MCLMIVHRCFVILCYSIALQLFTFKFRQIVLASAIISLCIIFLHFTSIQLHFKVIIYKSMVVSFQSIKIALNYLIIHYQNAYSSKKFLNFVNSNLCKI